MIIVKTEHDLGMSNLVFSTKEIAREHAREYFDSVGFEDGTFEDYEEWNLIEYIEFTLVE